MRLDDLLLKAAGPTTAAALRWGRGPAARAAAVEDAASRLGLDAEALLDIVRWSLSSPPSRVPGPPTCREDDLLRRLAARGVSLDDLIAVVGRPPPS